MLNLNSFLRFHLPPLIWIFVIFIVSSIPSDKIPNIQIFGIDKIVHIFAFFVLGILIYRSIEYIKGASPNYRKIALYVILIIAVVGVLDELYQGLIPGRSTDFFDFVADLIGGILSVFFAKSFMSIRGVEKTR